MRSVGTHAFASTRATGALPKNSRATHASPPSSSYRSPARNRSIPDKRRRHTTPGNGCSEPSSSESSPATTASVGLSEPSRSVMSTRENPYAARAFAAAFTRNVDDVAASMSSSAADRLGCAGRASEVVTVIRDDQPALPDTTKRRKTPARLAPGPVLEQVRAELRPGRLETS